MKISEVKKLSPLERLLYWIETRESIRLKKEAGEKPPWTDDEILQSYRFCNCRRMDDRVSKWLLENWYQPFFNHRNILPACALARFINLPSSLVAITDWVFRSGGLDPAWSKITNTLRSLKAQGPIFNGAYMVRGNDGMDKVECVVDYYVKPLVENKVGYYSNSMELTWEGILASYGMGSFMAGQITADLRWAADGEWEDRMDWAPIGPGSKKGMNYLHGRPAKAPLSQEKFLKELWEVIEVCEEFLSNSITDRLEAMDYQNCMCEYRAFVESLDGVKNPKRRYNCG